MTRAKVPAAVLLGPLEHFSRQLLGHVLRAAGTEVLSVADASDGIDGTVPGKDVVTFLVDPEQADWDTARALGAPIILVSSAEVDDDAVVGSVIDGADAVLNVQSSVDDIFATAELVGAGGTVLTATQVRLLAGRARDDHVGEARSVVQLTPRQVEILESVERGETVKQTARTLGITVKTVESIQGRLFRKLGVRNRAEALARVRALNLLPVVGDGNAVAEESTAP